MILLPAKISTRFFCYLYDLYNQERKYLHETPFLVGLLFFIVASSLLLQANQINNSSKYANIRSSSLAENDFDDSLLFILKRCSRQEINACNTILSFGFPSVRDCELLACSLIGATLSLANRDLEALGYLKKACSMRNVESCFALALSYESLRDYSNAKLTYQLACERNHAASCYNLGMLYVSKDLAKQSYSTASVFFQKACKNLYAKACFNMAVLYANGNGVEQDFSYAKMYFDRACDMELQEACIRLEELSKMNIKMPKPKKIRGFYMQEF
ncbi:tetratricopeptide repeat protein [Helicobacter sp. MIT 14-3879]|uniref:tetratricopeptide repeat protein n=1 Tax=Helicobacter sp. MIT 14-3879 TaxID=2040649 RepID=UPI000E1E6AA7|nr:tetratricopeptide repeat protein [Helicobacter sp. MIT 14-3879]RDU60394.1 hypothetical protein CQA44_10575 [Helicobacter sp. MIT 14-3879]